jgi:hypothetical protein
MIEKEKADANVFRMFVQLKMVDLFVINGVKDMDTGTIFRSV